MSDSKSILFIYTNYSTFVKGDYDLLASSFQVTKYHYLPVKGGIKNLFQLIRQFIFLLLKGRQYDTFYIWFADYHSLIPVLFSKLFKKKSVIVIGGYDVCRLRKLNYGAFMSPLRGWFCANSMRHCSLNLPVSKNVERKVKIIAPGADRKMVYNCIHFKNPEFSFQEKQNTVLTVGLIENERTFFLKGIDTFIEVASLLPFCNFIIIGINRIKLANLLSEIPSNLTIHEKVKPEDLAAYYSVSKIYCQLSRSESFGLAIAESMSYGAFPIVTNEGGMAEVVGPAGAVVRRDPQLIAKIIADQIETNPEESGKLAQNWVFDTFAERKRSAELIRILKRD